MPRNIVLSNHKLFIGIDHRGTIRDLYYPYVGQYNHLSGHWIRKGIFCAIENGESFFSWLDTDEWTIQSRYCSDTNTFTTYYSHPFQNLAVEEKQWLDSNNDIFHSKIKLSTSFDKNIHVGFFFTHDLRIDESDIGDTAFYHPLLNGIIHYKGDKSFLFTAQGKDGALDQYACGVKGFKEFQGTWLDAEDGKLGMNPIAQGSVDSTFRFQTTIQPHQDTEFTYSIIAASSIQDCEKIYSLQQAELATNRLLPPSKSQIEKKKGKTLESLYQQSIQMLLSHTSHNGAIIAACDSNIMETNRSNYCYFWPRDGAHIASILLKLDYAPLVDKYIDFIRDIFKQDPPYFLQKYRPDGCVGASWHPWIIDNQYEKAFQQDETALTIITVLEYIAKYPHSKKNDDLINNFIIPAGTFFCEHIYPEYDLPKPSWDLWEERRGIHFHTTCSVIKALKLMSCNIDIQNKYPAKAKQFQNLSQKMLQALNQFFWNNQEKRWYRCLFVSDKGDLIPDYAADSATLSYSLFQLEDLSNPKHRNNFDYLKLNLKINSDIGGYARYSGDYYFRRSEEYPGNPWIISTVWFGIVGKLLGETEDLEYALEWCLHRATDTYMLAEQYHPVTGELLSVSPLTWSHAEFINLYQIANM